jgi:hypothetical protein
VAVSAAVSVAAFSVVLAETFAAVGLSSLIPAGFITTARLVKEVAGPTPDPASEEDVNKLTAALTTEGKPGDAAGKLLTALARSVDDLDVLLPKDAKIHAEFEFHGSEGYSGEAAVGGQIELVTVKAGFSALYTASSSNKVTLDVDFASVHVEL